MNRIYNKPYKLFFRLSVGSVNITDTNGISLCQSRWGTPWRSWLKHCATIRKTAGSIPDGVIGILHGPRGRVKSGRCLGPTTLPPSCADLSWNLGTSTSWSPQGLSSTYVIYKAFRAVKLMPFFWDMTLSRSQKKGTLLIRIGTVCLLGQYLRLAFDHVACT